MAFKVGVLAVEGHPSLLLGRRNDLQEVRLQGGAAHEEAVDVLARGELIRV